MAGILAEHAKTITCTNIDFEGKTVSIIPEKGSNPRIWKMSNRLIGMLNRLPRKEQKVFSYYKNSAQTWKPKNIEDNVSHIETLESHD